MNATDILKGLKDAQEIATKLACDPHADPLWCRILYRIEEQIYSLDPLGSPFPFTTIKRTLNEQIIGLFPQGISRDEFIKEVKGGRF